MLQARFWRRVSNPRPDLKGIKARLRGDRDLPNREQPAAYPVPLHETLEGSGEILWPSNTRFHILRIERLGLDKTEIWMEEVL